LSLLCDFFVDSEMEFTNPPPIWMNTGNIAREFLGDHGPSISVDRQNNFLDGGTGSRPVDLHTSNMPKISIRCLIVDDTDTN
jgi:hypothetical protein